MKDKKPLDWHSESEVSKGWEAMIAFVIVLLLAFGIPAP